jgi:multiple sugar transport system ATP-binding protein
MARVSLTNVSKVYPGGIKAVDNVSLDIADAEFVVLVGPSGCGKSTTLRMVAGLEEITGGTIAIGDRVVNNVAPKDRDIAMVFQNYALYPHMSVYRNMAFALKLRRVPRAEIDQRVREAARILDIEHLLDRKPKALSGGQRQRVAVGRAIVRDPACFLFDEPLSNLDAKLRVTTRAELKRLHNRLKTTTIYVTHDQEEAMTLGDRIVVMKDGVIQQADTPLETYQHPVNRFVAGFIGMPPMNFFHGMIREEGGGLVFEEGALKNARRVGGDEDGGGSVGESTDGPAMYVGELGLPGDGFKLPLPGGLAARVRAQVGRHVVLGIRPEHFELGMGGAADVAGLEAMLNVVEPLGSDMDVYLSTRHHPHVVARVVAQPGLRSGQAARLSVNLDRAHVFEPEETGANLTLDRPRAAVA